MVLPLSGKATARTAAATVSTAEVQSRRLARWNRVSSQYLHDGRSDCPSGGYRRTGPFGHRLAKQQPGWQRRRHLCSKIRCRRRALETPFRVNTYTADDQAAPSVATDAAGNFIIAWESYGQDGSSDGIYAQRYSAAGTPVGTEFRVNNYTTSNQNLASVAMDDLGRFVIAWSGYSQDGNGYGVFAQAFNSDGTPSGPEFSVNTYTDSSQYYPSIAMDARGGFVVAWRSENQDGSGAGVFAKQFTDIKRITFTTRGRSGGDRSECGFR